MHFVHTELPQTVHFAPSDAPTAIAHARERIGSTRLFLIASEREIARARTLLSPEHIVSEFTEVRVHVPTHLAQRAISEALNAHADCVIAVGGGSAIGFAKAIALETGLPIIAVPTTYAGSEATDMWGMTEDSVKRTGTSPAVLPGAVVYDSQFTAQLPEELTKLSGVNALAHCIDAMWAPRTDPFIRATAEEGIRQVSTALRTLAINPHDAAAREHALLGVYLSGRSFSQSGSGLHHKLCHILGGRFDLPHAHVHAAVLPAVTALNMPAAPEAEERVARALGANSAVTGLTELYLTMSIAPSLRQLGVDYDELDATVQLCLAAVPDRNPAPVTETTMRQLLESAWHGVSVKSEPN